MAGTAGKRVGAINVGVFAQTRKFVKQIGIARAAVGKFVKGIKSMIFNVKTLGAAIAAGVFAKFVKDAFVAIDSLAKTADKLGVTTEALAGLRLAASEAGVEQETLNKALTMMVKNIGEVAGGTGEAASALEMLGLQARDLNRLSPDRQFIRIANAIKQLKNRNSQLLVATELFGSRASALINLLRKGRGAFSEAELAAVKLGLAIDRKTAAGVERAIDAFNRLRSVVTGIFRQIAAEIAPLVEGISVALTDFATKNGRAGSLGRGIGRFIVEVFERIADGFQKAIAMFMRLIANINDLIISFRQTGIARDMGVGFPAPPGPKRLAVGGARGSPVFLPQGTPRPSMSTQEQQARARSKSIRDSADRLMERSFSSFLESFREKNKRRIHGQFFIGGNQSSFTAGSPNRFRNRLGPADNTSGARQFRQTIGRLIMSTITSSSTFRNIRQVGGDAIQGRHAMRIGFHKMMWNLMQTVLRNGQGDTGPSRNALGLARASSSEGFRQRVAALRGTNDVPKKQLKVQEKIQENTKKQATAMAAIAGNIGVADL